MLHRHVCALSQRNASGALLHTDTHARNSVHAYISAAQFGMQNSTSACVRSSSPAGVHLEPIRQPNAASTRDRALPFSARIDPRSDSRAKHSRRAYSTGCVCAPGLLAGCTVSVPQQVSHDRCAFRSSYKRRHPRLIAPPPPLVPKTSSRCYVSRFPRVFVFGRHCTSYYPGPEIRLPGGLREDLVRCIGLSRAALGR